MFKVITLLFAGVLVGYLLREGETSRRIGRPITWTIYLLLFLLGLSAGANETVRGNLAALGGEALLIAVAATLGSALAAWGVYRLFFRERRRK